MKAGKGLKGNGIKKSPSLHLGGITSKIRVDGERELGAGGAIGETGTSLRLRSLSAWILEEELWRSQEMERKSKANKGDERRGLKQRRRER